MSILRLKNALGNWIPVPTIKGEPGDTGRGIVSVVRTSGTGAQGTVDTYTITYSDGTTDTFQIRNGADGSGAGDMTKAVYDADGNGIVDDAEKLGGQLPSHYLAATQKGVAGGLAELDAGGKVPSSQLPSYVDDVLEYAALGSFPAAGEAGKIYIALDTNKTYRWGGSAYVEIAQGVTLGETSTTAYRGDRGKAAYDHSQTSGNAHGLTLAELGAQGAPAQLTALPASGTAIANNAEYRVSATVGTYAFAWPSSPFEAWLKFTTAATVAITFPSGTTYIGGAPAFKASTTYEMSVKDGVVIIQEVKAS